MLNLSFCVISEKDLKTTAKQISYRDALITDMKEFVDEFYSEMSVKISSITKDQKREIRDIKNKMKPATPSSGSVKLFKQSSEYTLNSNLTISSWASEKQYELNKQLFQLVSEGRSEQPLQQWDSSDVNIISAMFTSDVKRGESLRQVKRKKRSILECAPLGTVTRYLRINLFKYIHSQIQNILIERSIKGLQKGGVSWKGCAENGLNSSEVRWFRPTHVNWKNDK